MDCFTFGEKLLSTNDIDPVYVLLWEAEFSNKKMKRWLLAYWCFYHVGTASWIADDPKFYWSRFRKAAESKEYPRCPERRHFRAKNATNSVAYLKSVGVQRLFEPLLSGKFTTAISLMKEVKKWVGFGPWIAFKVVDMLERLKLAPVSFDTETLYLFDSPKEGAQRLAQSLTESENVPETGREAWAVKRILEELGDHLAPPRYERKINGQEVETILCKWKSSLNGHYKIGEDIESCRKSLKRFENVRTARQLQRGAIKGGLWTKEN